MIGMARLGTSTRRRDRRRTAQRPAIEEGLAAEPVLALDGRLEHVVAVLDPVDDLGVLGRRPGGLGLGLELLVGDTDPGGGRPQLRSGRGRPAAARARRRRLRSSRSVGAGAEGPAGGRRVEPAWAKRSTSPSASRNRRSRRAPGRCRRPGGGRWPAGTRRGGGRRRRPARGGRPSGCDPRAPISSPDRLSRSSSPTPAITVSAGGREGERGRPCFDHEPFVPHPADSRRMLWPS